MQILLGGVFLSKVRYLFPGNNTPMGFFSYYKFILGQQEANKIVCIKGGPGVGKSTFMRKIAEEFEGEEDIDYLYCSSNPESLDGIVLKNRKVAFVDGTAPHVVEPINPGAVDSIINLGECWNEEGIKIYRNQIMKINERKKRWYFCAYNHLAAAGKLYEILTQLYDDNVESAEIYMIAAKIVGDELAHKEICLKPGIVKKLFLSAITPDGNINYLKNAIEGYEKIYILNVPVGLGNERLLNIFSESAIYRGLEIEQYYCPMNPRTKVEHLLIPQLKIAFITTNKYHDIEPWEIVNNSDEQLKYPIVKIIDINDIIDWKNIESLNEYMKSIEEKLDEQLQVGIGCLEKARQEHNELENYYIPNMDFKKIDEIRQDFIAKIR